MPGSPQSLPGSGSEETPYYKYGSVAKYNSSRWLFHSLWQLVCEEEKTQPQRTRINSEIIEQHEEAKEEKRGRRAW